MSRKKSVKLAAKTFVRSLYDIFAYFEGTRIAVLPQKYQAWCTDYAVIRLYGEFETLMLKALVGAVNNDTDTLSQSSGYKFPKDLSQDVCTYLVIGMGYFDFKGRSGLIRKLGEFVPKTHYLLTIVKDPKYKDTLERLIALRNFAAHHSEKSKQAAIEAIGGERIGSAGTWLGKQDRFEHLCISLKRLANEIEQKAPY